jgi:hypothetical protein
MLRRVTHWLYCFLIRRHPDRFRQRFGEQMLSNFDDYAADRNNTRLLFDAGVSLLRQWLFRSDDFHRGSKRFQTLVKLANLAWVRSIIPLE